jgi:hypothetical protein
MALVVSGQVRHRHMQPDQVHAALRKHLPGLLVSAPDFAVDRSTCRVRFSAILRRYLILPWCLNLTPVRRRRLLRSWPVKQKFLTLH